VPQLTKLIDISNENAGHADGPDLLSSPGRTTKPPNQQATTHLSACSGGGSALVVAASQGVAHLAGANLQFVGVAMAKTMPSTKQTREHIPVVAVSQFHFSVPKKRVFRAALAIIVS